jgi:hypothetical protein
MVESPKTAKNCEELGKKNCQGQPRFFTALVKVMNSNLHFFLIKYTDKDFYGKIMAVIFVKSQPTVNFLPKSQFFGSFRPNKNLGY